MAGAMFLFGTRRDKQVEPEFDENNLFGTKTN